MPRGETHSIPESEADVLYEAIDNYSGLIGSSSANPSSTNLSRADSITGGVGTTFYMAPEQEKGNHLRSKHGSTSYDSKADMFSLGINMFEMFMLKPLGATYMERAEILTALRGEARSNTAKASSGEDGALFSEKGEIIGDWQHVAKQKFPENFRQSVPVNAQKIILWCLESKGATKRCFLFCYTHFYIKASHRVCLPFHSEQPPISRAAAQKQSPPWNH